LHVVRAITLMTGILALTRLWACGPVPTPATDGRSLESPGPASWRGTVFPGLVVTPPATSGAAPEPADHYAFAFDTGGTSILARYRMDTHDVTFFPQAGEGLGSVSEPYPFVFFYDLDGDIVLYDVNREERVTLVDGREVGGFAFSPSIDKRDALYFLGTADPDLADQGIGFAYAAFAPTPPASGDYHAPRDGDGLSKVVAIAPINALADAHGGVTSLRIANKGGFAVFSTADGGLYLYRTDDHTVLNLLPTSILDQPAFADSPRVDPYQNRYVVWQDLSTRRTCVLDLWNGHVDVVPYLNGANGGSIDPAPSFIDAYRIVFSVQPPSEEGGAFLVLYDIRTESLAILLALDAFETTTGRREEG